MLLIVRSRRRAALAKSRPGSNATSKPLCPLATLLSRRGSEKSIGSPLICSTPNARPTVMTSPKRAELRSRARARGRTPRRRGPSTPRRAAGRARSRRPRARGHRWRRRRARSRRPSDSWDRTQPPTWYISIVSRVAPLGCARAPRSSDRCARARSPRSARAARASLAPARSGAAGRRRRSRTGRCTSVPVGGEPRARAVAAERLSDRRDHADLAAPSRSASAARPRRGSSARAARAAAPRRSARGSRARVDDLAAGSSDSRADVHELDEAHDVAGAAEATREVDQRVVVHAALHHAVDLDRREAGALRRRDARRARARPRSRSPLMRRKTSSSRLSRQTVTRRRPASASGSACSASR